MASRQDVMAEIERQFTAAERTPALKTVNLITGKPGEREDAQLAILGRSGGNLEQLRSLVDSAKGRSSGRASPAITDAASAQRAQAAAAAQLVAARHVAGQDASAVVGSSREYYPFRWVFYIAIGLIPVYTLGGAIPFGIAAGGISAVRQIITDARQPLATRAIFSAGITVACWGVLFALAAVLRGN